MVSLKIRARTTGAQLENCKISDYIGMEFHCSSPSGPFRLVLLQHRDPERILLSCRRGSTILHDVNSWQVGEVFVRSYKRQTECFGCSGKKVVSGITVGEGYIRNSQCNLDGKRCFNEFKVNHSPSNPCREITWQCDASFPEQDDQFPYADGREPQFIRRFSERLLHAA